MLHVLSLAESFRPAFPFPYPGHQRGALVEEFVHRRLAAGAAEPRLRGAWVYLPVYWTSYACRMSVVGRWRRRAMRRRMEALLAALPPGYRYFTVSQHDDGLAQRGEYCPSQPILEFSAGGCGDVPIPLLCDPHPRPLPERRRDVRASFVGALAGGRGPYRCRAAMAAALAGRPEYVVRDVPAQWGKIDDAQQARQTAQFVDLMSRSTFALCPRGYGKTSFRLYEALQLGAVPVYLYDEPWLPYAEQLDWREFCVLVPEKRIGELHDVLAGYSAADIARMQARGRELWAEFFTLDGVVRQVMRYLAAAEATTADVAHAA